MNRSNSEKCFWCVTKSSVFAMLYSNKPTLIYVFCLHFFILFFTHAYYLISITLHFLCLFLSISFNWFGLKRFPIVDSTRPFLLKIIVKYTSLIAYTVRVCVKRFFFFFQVHCLVSRDFVYAIDHIASNKT